MTDVKPTPDFTAALAAFVEAHQAAAIAAGLPGWMQPQLAAREADEDRAARRREYDAWALRYADSGVRVPGRQHEAVRGEPEAQLEAEIGR
jgi:hypothetical protein